jgi:peptidoglycan-N-acetylglucosamine deacetylase
MMHKVVLTFDDGPDPRYTPRILDVLAAENIRAVFFVLGERVEAPGGLALVRRAAAEGHLIGNHTFSHPNLTTLSLEDVRAQIMRTHELIAEFESKRKLFRPPYGACNNAVSAVANELGYKTVLWTVNSEDWVAENESAAWVDTAMKQIVSRHLAICLCHDLACTADYLPRLLREVKQLSNREFVSYQGRRDLRWLASGIGRRARGCFSWAQLPQLQK